MKVFLVTSILKVTFFVTAILADIGNYINGYLQFGSWTYDGSKLNLTEAENSFDTSNYMDNGEWILKSKFSWFSTLHL